MHRIRLRGPWRAALEDGTEIEFSWPWSPPAACRAELRRGFQRPPNLEGCRVLLIVEGPAPTTLCLNGAPLDSAAADVTELLEPRNEITMEVQRPPDEIRLEIHEPSDAP